MKQRLRNTPTWFQCLFKGSKWIHKYIGLLLVLFLAWMSISGILLNHPHWISDIAVPNILVPNHYDTRDWNRSSLINLIYTGEENNRVFIGGKKGVWKSEDGGKTFTAMQNGFPKSPYYRKTNHIFHLDKKGKPSQLWAATDGGLYYCDLDDETWHEAPLGLQPEKTQKIIQTENQLLVFTESSLYRGNLDRQHLKFVKVELPRREHERRVSLIKLFFDLHDGHVFGLPGKLTWDMIGLILFFLSISAFYAWFYPKHKRRQRLKNGAVSRGKFQARLFRLIVRYHIKLGIWVAAILLIIGATGLFMRPPLIVAIAKGDMPAQYYPGILPDNPWEEKIHNALYDAKRDVIVIAASDGLWQGPADISRPFEKKTMHVPLFVMGPQVFEYEAETDRYLVGSFSGMFAYDPKNDRAFDLINRKAANLTSNVRPAEHMVTGYFETPRGESFITNHEKGLMGLNGAGKDGRFRMPEAVNRVHALSLWNFMFELHNGRLFKDIVGSFYILIAPLGSMLFLLILLSGIWDWFYLKVRNKQKDHNKRFSTTRRKFKKAV